MKKGVTKLQLIKSLEATVKLTRAEVKELELFDDETVVIRYQDGHSKFVDIAADSGRSIIVDVVRCIE